MSDDKIIPSVTDEAVESNIASEFYFTAADWYLGHTKLRDVPGSLCMDLYRELIRSPIYFCVLVLKSGVAVTGEGAFANPEDVDDELGRKRARANAVSKARYHIMGSKLSTA
jgi:hypothetical protein